MVHVVLFEMYFIQIIFLAWFSLKKSRFGDYRSDKTLLGSPLAVVLK